MAAEDSFVRGGKSALERQGCVDDPAADSPSSDEWRDRTQSPPNHEERTMARMRPDNVTDYHPDNPWGASDVWHHHGAAAVGNCSAYVEANPDASDDALWVKAEAVAAQVFDVHRDSGCPVRDAGLLAAIDATMVPMLFACMKALREHLRYRRLWLEESRSREAGSCPEPACG